MNRTRILRWTAAATLLIGGFAVGAVVTGHAGRILKLFSTKSSIQATSDATGSSGSTLRAYPAKQGGHTDAREGSGTVAVGSSLPPGALDFAATRPDDSPALTIADRAAIGSGAGLGGLGDEAIEIEFAANAISGGTSAAGTIGNSAASQASGNRAQAGAWAPAGGSLPASSNSSGLATSAAAIAGATPAANSTPAAPIQTTSAPIVTAKNAPAAIPAPAAPAQASVVPAAPASAAPVQASAAPAASVPAAPAPVPVAVAVSTTVTVPAAVTASGPAPSGGTTPSGSPAASAPLPLPSNFVQTGGETVIDNVLYSDTVDILGGHLGGHGTIETALVTIGAGATLGPGNSPGVFTIDGSLLEKGVLEIEIAGTYYDPDNPLTTQYDVLKVSGTVEFAPGSVLKFVLYDIYHPANGDEFEFLQANLIKGLENLTYTIAGLPAGFGYQVYTEVENGKTNMYVQFYSQAQGAAAPDPDQCREQMSCPE